MIDYYELLGVSSTASSTDIRQAYCRLALKWHPDKNLTNQSEATTKFTELSHAYEILGDATKRLNYDSERMDFFDPFGFGISPMKRENSLDAESESTSAYQFKEPEQVFKECFKDDFDLDFGSFGGTFSCPTSTVSNSTVTFESRSSVHRGRSISKQRKRSMSTNRGRSNSQQHKRSMSTNRGRSISINRGHSSLSSHKDIPSRTHSSDIISLTSRTVTTSITTSVTISNGRRVEKKTKVKKCVEVKEVIQNGEVVSCNTRDVGDESDNRKDKSHFSLPKFLRLNWYKSPKYSRL